MNNKPKTKLLTLSLLCCGRPDTTERCLKSLQPFRDAIDCELQVVDTGCDKETRAVIDKYADEVFEFKWCNDFAKARNVQIDEANGQWLLYLDDDEYFEDAKDLIDFFVSGKCDNYSVAGYIQKNYLDLEKKEWMDTRVLRATKITPETKFIGKVHEYIWPCTGGSILFDSYVGHFGYVYATEEDNIKHSKRNIPLLLEMIEEGSEGDPLRWPYQLSQEYNAIHDYEALLDLDSRYLDMLESDPSQDNQGYRGTFAVGKAIGLEHSGKFVELVEHYKWVRAHEHIYPLAKARVALYATRAYFVMGKYEECVEACNYYLEQKKQLAEDELAIFIQGGIFLDDTFSETFNNHVYTYLITCGLMKNDATNLHAYASSLLWDVAVIRINKSFMKAIIGFGGSHKFNRDIRDVLDKFNIRNGTRYALLQEIYDYAKIASVEELNSLKSQFAGNSHESEMMGYIDLKLFEKELNGTQWTSFSSTLEQLNLYATKAHEWVSLHDENAKKYEDVNLVMTEHKLANMIDEFAKNSEQDYKRALEILRDAVSLETGLSDVIVAISKLYADYQIVLRAKAADPDKFAEMYKLEEAVRAQISELEATGHGADASTTRGQLEAILMQTYGVKSLH